MKAAESRKKKRRPPFPGPPHFFLARPPLVERPLTEGLEQARKRAAGPEVEFLQAVSQFSPSHSSRGFAARFRGYATQTPTKPPATQANFKPVRNHQRQKGSISFLYCFKSGLKFSIVGMFSLLLQSQIKNLASNKI